MIILNRSFISEMEDHARREIPNEACGILAGRSNKVEKVFSCKNVSKNPSSRYAIAPEELIEIFNDVETCGLEILGFYHSHPSGPTSPSNIDLSEASWHDHSYVILHSDGMGSWRWNEEKCRFTGEEIRVI
ncbi:MAG: M67 family metallopeptidase [Candidatus Hydrothermarchaeaceae archaeon]